MANENMNARTNYVALGKEIDVMIRENRIALDAKRDELEKAMLAGDQAQCEVLGAELDTMIEAKHDALMKKRAEYKMCFVD